MERNDAISVSSSAGQVVIAAFDTHRDAETAVTELERAGFDPAAIGFAIPGGDAGGASPTYDQASMRPEAEGVLAGGMIGGVLATVATLLVPGFGPVLAGGLLASFFGGTLAGSAVGGVLGALRSVGASDEDAELYHEHLRAGRAVVAVRAGGRALDAERVLIACGGQRPAAAALSEVGAPEMTDEGLPKMDARA